MEDINKLLFERDITSMTNEELDEHIRMLRTNRAEITLGRTPGEQKKIKEGKKAATTMKIADLTPEQLAYILSKTKGVLG